MSRKIKLKNQPKKVEEKIETKKMEVSVASAKPKKEKKESVAGVPQHELPTSYMGASKAVNLRKSRTLLPLESFGSKIDAILTDRDNDAIKALKTKYGRSEFQRGNLDAGIIRRLGERGIIEHVSGDAMSPQTTFKLTERAF